MLKFDMDLRIRHRLEAGRRSESYTDFLKFVFILLDIGPAPRNFLLDPLNFCRTYIFYINCFKAKQCHTVIIILV